MREEDLGDRRVAVLDCNHQGRFAVTFFDVDLDAFDRDEEADEVFFLTRAGHDQWRQSMSETEVDIESFPNQLFHLLHITSFTCLGDFLFLGILRAC